MHLEVAFVFQHSWVSDCGMVFISAIDLGWNLYLAFKIQLEGLSTYLFLWGMYLWYLIYALDEFLVFVVIPMRM